MSDRPAPPRLALTQQEAAAALGVSVETFVEHIRPTLPSVPAGSRRLYRVSAIEEWLQEQEIQGGRRTAA